ncbi:hypothetical protein D9Q98_002496 [Chlorella vulgaris]|uniref:Uncharacterized protein n=1 Tax=Chlorella vulgaris TaxID=3077 RepID=A0A9D4TTB8_CHLVU|nr:hypothetical protein D9Q98_002496 [Chlorella vulgaris]
MPSSQALDLTGMMASCRAPAGGTEEVPLMQRMRYPLPAPSFAASTAWGHDRFYAKFIPRIGAGAAYLPADHPLTREAERLRDIHLAAMEALVVEQHGADSAVAAAFRANVRSRPIPIRVYKCGSPRMYGFTDGNCIAIRDTEATPHKHIIPHELAHVVLRHVAELQLTATHEQKAKLLSDSVTRLDSQRTALLGSTSCLPMLRRLPPGGLHSGLHSSLVVGSLRNLAAAVDPAFSSRAVLRTPHPGFNKVPWQTVLAELGADRLAVLSMAQAGYDPCPAIHSRLFPLGPTMANWYELQAALLTAAARDPAAVTTLTASDGIGSGGLLWPNREKQAHNFAQVCQSLGVMWMCAQGV